MAKISNPRFPHVCKIYRTVVAATDVAEDPDVDEGDTEQTSEEVCYEGKCRSYDHDTTSDRGDVITQVRILALPLKQDEWTESTIPHKGDRVEVSKISFKEWGTVIDVRPNNLGTNVLWRYNE